MLDYEIVYEEDSDFDAEEDCATIHDGGCIHASMRLMLTSSLTCSIHRHAKIRSLYRRRLLPLSNFSFLLFAVPHDALEDAVDEDELWEGALQELSGELQRKVEKASADEHKQHLLKDLKAALVALARGLQSGMAGCGDVDQKEELANQFRSDAEAIAETELEKLKGSLGDADDMDGKELLVAIHGTLITAPCVDGSLDTCVVEGDEVLQDVLDQLPYHLQTQLWPLQNDDAKQHLLKDMKTALVTLFKELKQIEECGDEDDNCGNDDDMAEGSKQEEIAKKFLADATAIVEHQIENIRVVVALEKNQHFQRADPLMVVHVPSTDTIKWAGVPIRRGSYAVSLAVAAAAHVSSLTSTDTGGGHNKQSPFTAAMADSYLAIARMLASAALVEGGGLLLPLPLDGPTSEELGDDEHNQVRSVLCVCCLQHFVWSIDKR
jgi:hypothetical protein